MNVGIYAPVGLTGNLAFRRFGRPWLSLMAPILIGGIFSASIEMTQLWVPGRTCSIVDLATNVAGTIVGVVLAVALEDIFLDRRRHSPNRKSPQQVALALLGCGLFWFWFPLMPVMGRTMLGEKIGIFVGSRLLDPVPLVSMFLVWFAAGTLLHAGGLRPAGRYAALSVLLIPSQIFVLSRQPVSADLVGAILGATAFAIYWPNRTRHGNAHRKPLAWAFLAWIVVRGLMPFRLLPDAAPFFWVPFGGFLNMDWQAGAQLVAEKCFWYGTAIWLLRSAGLHPRSAIGLVAAVLFGVELAQTRIPGHVAEITDPLLAAVSGFGLTMISRRQRAAPDS